MSTPAGWYDDGHGTQRWWDGTAWTEHVQPAAAAPVSDEVPAAPAEPVASVEPAEPVASASAPMASEQPAASAAPEYAASAPQTPAENPAFVAPGYAAPGAVPAGYPPTAGYPGAPGAPAAPEAPKKKSKLWILWVVLGGVVLLLVIAAAILIPLLIGLFSSAAGGGSASTDGERAAVAAVELYDEAFDDADCTAYEESTTQAFRENDGYPVCDDFVTAAEDFGDTTEDYEVEITGVSTESDGSITVTTDESYLSYLDSEGNRIDAPEPVVDPFVYTIVDDGGRWAIDSVE